MEVPEKLYVSVGDAILDIYSKKESNEEIEYTRTDAFIEKACEILDRMICEVTYVDLEEDCVQHYDKMEFIEDFKNYMKGE